MASPIIRVEGLGKRYRLGRSAPHQTFRDALTAGVAAPWRWTRAAFSSRREAVEETIWALKDVSFEIRPGEIVGIIGRNGAGKSTLLKILSRITAPTEGVAEIRGRLGSLLEVGTGFHPELSGRDNVFLNGAMLGMPKREIERKLEAIVEFSEIGRFVDTQVKHYSSGMYMRLAFSVAAHLEPDIFVLDEVLAVGDASFQRKCLAKMDDVARGGRTVLFVSHNMTAIRHLCGRAIVLDAGRRVAEGPTEAMVAAYLSQLLKPLEGSARWKDDLNPAEYRDAYRLDRVEVVGRTGAPTSTVAMDEPVEIRMHHRVLKPFPALRLTVELRLPDQTMVLASTDADGSAGVFGLARQPGQYVTRCEIPAQFLSPTQYLVDVRVQAAADRPVAGAEQVVSFEVLETEGPMVPKRHGVVNPLLKWDHQRKA